MTRVLIDEVEFGVAAFTTETAPDMSAVNTFQSHVPIRLRWIHLRTVVMGQVTSITSRQVVHKAENIAAHASSSAEHTA